MRSQYESNPLFPDCEPLRRMRLAVGDGHELYLEECGNPRGIPVVFLHGGPGAGIGATHRRFFDPALFRIILFDQRASGRSTPFASVEANTTWHLVADMEKIRAHLGVDQWIVFGGSWGSTLGLAYGMRHPERCLGFVFRGVFLGTRSEVRWFLDGMAAFFPEAWERFARVIPEAERGDLLTAYAARLMRDDPAIAIPAADAWSSYENSCSTLRGELRGGGGRMALSLARLEAHYFMHNCFLDDTPIMDGLAVIRHLPAIIVQGRHDVICPPRNARRLAQKWGQAAEMVMVEDAGHSAFEPGMARALVEGLSRITQRIIGFDA